jgi:hypothetical protein
MTLVKKEEDIWTVLLITFDFESMNSNFKKYLLEITGSTECSKSEVIQSLWSGYGEISRFQLEGTSLKSVVVKCISLDIQTEHPRGWNTNTSHNRKVKSYQVETYWYKQWSQKCNESCKIPQFVGSYQAGDVQWIILEDLNANYPLRKQQISFSEVKVCLKWLSNFHAQFLNEEPTGLWETGTYWHLETRPDELEKIENQELKMKAHLIDEALDNCCYRTIVHGDAKLANFCFAKDGEAVAAVDFQYVGGGCGMKDVAYFLGSCLSGDECELYETELLNYYFSELQLAIDSNIDFIALENEWRGMYLLACADFTRFLLGWMPTHQKVNDYNLRIMNTILKRF